MRENRATLDRVSFHFMWDARRNQSKEAQNAARVKEKKIERANFQILSKNRWKILESWGESNEKVELKA